MERDVQENEESSEERVRSDSVQETDHLVHYDDNNLDIQVHSTANKVSTFFMSLIASMPNIDIKYLEKILLEKVICVVAKRRGLSQLINEVRSRFTALHAACLLNNLELVKLFVERGANINAQTRSGLTPLHVLLNQPKIDTGIVDYLINHGADLTLKDSRYQTLLYIAVKMSHMAAVRIILQQPCDIDALCGYCNKTALMLAASNKELEIVKLLLANGADPNIVEYDENYMAIHFSVIPGNEEIFKCLLDVSNCESIRKCEPLAKVIIDKKCIDCLKVLSESVYKEDLLLKETYDNYFDMIEICEKYEKSCLIGYTLLSFEKSMDSVNTHKKLFNEMINIGLSVNSLSEECIPPLTAAAVANSGLLLDEPEYYIKKLINHGADVNYPEPRSPEALLCSLIDKEVTLLLLQHSNFATPDSVLNSCIQMDEISDISYEISDISSDVIHLFFKLGIMPSTINKLGTLPFLSEEIPNYDTLTQNVCTLKQLCRISLRHFFYAKYRNLSITEILNNLYLPDCIKKYLRYEIL